MEFKNIEDFTLLKTHSLFEKKNSAAPLET